MKKFDAIIIGFGKGGKTLAVDLAGRGWNVAMIERSEKMYGGTCINTGCIPTKTLIHKAKLATQAALPDFGAREAFYKQAVAFKNQVTAGLREQNYRNLADRPGITVYTGEGSFVSVDTVAVRTKKGAIELTARHIFINTGAESVLPPIEGVGESDHVYTSTSIMDLDKLPRRLVVIGGGYIGLEFASMYASFGSEVTVLEGFSELIPREDRDIAMSVRDTLEKKGITFVLQAKVQAVCDRNGYATVVYTDGSDRVRELDAEAVLVATGRKPATAGLNLEAAGVETDERGAIRVDERLRTSNPDIRAIGDVKGGLQFTYISLDDYRIIRDEMFGDGRRNTGDREPVSYTVFIDPPLARIGMSEEEARKKGYEIKVKKIAVASIPRVRTLDETDGLLKSITDAKTGKILGCTLFCPEAGEVVNTVSLAMKAGFDHTVLRDFIYTHPSMSEALNDLFS